MFKGLKTDIPKAGKPLDVITGSCVDAIGLKRFIYTESFDKRVIGIGFTLDDAREDFHRKVKED